MGLRDVIEEYAGTLLGFGLVSASAVLSTAKSVVLTVVGDEDPDGDEELDECEIFGHAPLMYRPSDSSSAGQMEVMFLRDGDERVVISTKDRRWQIEPAKGEVILSALGKDGTAQARISLKADGSIAITSDTVTVTSDTATIVADTIKLGSSGATKHVAFREDLEAALSTVRSIFNTHTHSAGLLLDGSALACTGSTATPSATLTDPGDLGSDKVFVE